MPDWLRQLLATAVQLGRLTVNEARRLADRLRGHRIPATLQPIPIADAVMTSIPPAILAAAVQRAQQTGDLDTAQDAYAVRVARLAPADDDLDVQTWHGRMRDDVATHLVEAAVLAGMAATPLDLAATTVRQQHGFLYRFAVDVCLGKLLAFIGGIQIAQRFTWTRRAIAARAVTYSGAARGLWYRVRNAMQPTGVVALYESVDSPTTCGPCLDAEGVYLPADCPLPGVVCLGKGRCRCRISYIYDPERATELAARSGIG